MTRPKDPERKKKVGKGGAARGHEGPAKKGRTFGELAGDPSTAKHLPYLTFVLDNEGLVGDPIAVAKKGDAFTAACLLEFAAELLHKGEPLPPRLAHYLADALRGIAAPWTRWMKRPVTDFTDFARAEFAASGKRLEGVGTRKKHKPWHEAAIENLMKPTVDRDRAHRLLNLVGKPWPSNRRVKALAEAAYAQAFAVLREKGWSKTKALEAVAVLFNVSERTIDRAATKIPGACGCKSCRAATKAAK